MLNLVFGLLFSFGILLRYHNSNGAFFRQKKLEGIGKVLLVFLPIYEMIEVIENKTSANPHYNGGLTEAFLCFKYTFMFYLEVCYECLMWDMDYITVL